MQRTVITVSGLGCIVCAHAVHVSWVQWSVVGGKRWRGGYALRGSGGVGKDCAVRIRVDVGELLVHLHIKAVRRGARNEALRRDSLRTRGTICMYVHLCTPLALAH